MARYLGPVCKLCRREGVKLFLKGTRCETAKCPIEKKAGKPGQHGAAAGRFSKMSEYSIRLREKQKAKRIAGLTEAQFFHYFQMASKMKGLAGSNLLQLLTLRLDNVVRSLGFAPSVRAARQMVRHGHILVNDKKVDLPGCVLSVGDKVTLSKKISTNPSVPLSQRDVTPPQWLSFNKETLTGTVVALPQKEETPYSSINEQYIVELYSK